MVSGGLAITPDSKFCFFSTGVGHFFQYSTTDGSLVKRWNQLFTMAGAIVALSNNKHVFVAGGKWLKQLSLEGPEPEIINTFKTKSCTRIDSMTATDNDQYLVLGYSPYELKIFAISTEEVIFSHELNISFFTQLFWSPFYPNQFVYDHKESLKFCRLEKGMETRESIKIRTSEK